MEGKVVDVGIVNGSSYTPIFNLILNPSIALNVQLLVKVNKFKPVGNQKSKNVVI